MKQFIRPSAGLRLTSHIHLHVRPFQHTYTTSSPAGKDSISDASNDKQAQQAPHDSEQNNPALSDTNSASSGAAKKKTVAEMDEELRLKLEGMSGGGGSAGIEYENGKAEGLKRGVKSNMFRVI
ncbi:hypothetical protein N8I77_007575 [Diaporthe amygdali]|uniref:Uncharacterized protein n=1 Tax=Phomopsis amygdali TaxID=1214568 RepID=A0AAD9SDJ0_PHOAM|nr:hypothetical protein N8I77_007575 [Diaporthe amygdali]